MARQETPRMTLHREVADVRCGGQVTSGRDLFGTDFWCVYCGAKFNVKVRCDMPGGTT